MTEKQKRQPLIGASVTQEIRERLQAIATERRWTLSQTVKVFLESYLDAFERDMGIHTNEVVPTPTRKKSKPKTKPDIK